MAIHEFIHRRLTYQDYLLFPEDGNRHELIDGEHFVTPAPSWRHQKTSFNLSHLFGEFLSRNPLGHVVCAPFEVVLSDEDVVQPDLLFISNERFGIVTGKNAEGAPDLMIEILSESTRKADETRKLRLYERAGALEYWMFDTARETACIYRREGDRLVLTQELSAAAGDVLDTPLLPGLQIPLAEIFL